MWRIDIVNLLHGEANRWLLTRRKGGVETPDMTTLSSCLNLNPRLRRKILVQLL